MEVEVERKPDGSVTIFDGYELVSMHADDILSVVTDLLDAHEKNLGLASDQEQEEPPR